MPKKKKNITMKEKTIVSSVTKEMDEPRLAESIRNEVIVSKESRIVVPAEKPALSHAKRH